MRRSHGLSIAVLGAVLLAGAPPAGATVELQSQAKKLGFAIKNCLDCHASPHAIEAMKKKAQDLKMAEGNCLACHGATIPASLNHKGNWLVTEKDRRGAKEFDMAWLKEYQEPPPPKPPAAKPKAKPEPAPNP
jgi:mono/diheme cytochrome c family protein